MKELQLPHDQRGEFWQRVMNDPESLTRDDRDLRDSIILSLYHAEDKSSKKVAQILGMSPRTIRYTVSKYKKDLKKSPRGQAVEEANFLNLQAEVHRGTRGMMAEMWDVVGLAHGEIRRRLEQNPDEIKDRDLVALYKTVADKVLLFSHHDTTRKTAYDATALDDQELRKQWIENSRMLTGLMGGPEPEIVDVEIGEEDTAPGPSERVPATPGAGDSEPIGSESERESGDSASSAGPAE